MTATVGVERRGLAVSTHGLVHIYRSEGHDVAALAGVDLDVRAGEMVGLLGPSGAGKSTLLTLFGGLMRPSAGRIRIGGHDLGPDGRAALDEYRAADVGLVLQGAGRNLLPYLDARENVAFAQRARPRGRAPGPDPGGGPRPGGPRRRRPDAAGHAHARAGSSSPRWPSPSRPCPGLLLADEPTSQLDHEARDLVLDRLHDVNRQVGTTIVLVTHDAEVAARLPRTVTIRDGRVGGEGRRGEDYAVVSADGSLPLPDDVLRRPAARHAGPRPPRRRPLDPPRRGWRAGR